MSTTGRKVPILDVYPGELALILLMWVSSAYMWYGSYDYSGMAGAYPRFMAIIVFVLSSVLLFRGLLPEPLRVTIEGEAASLTDTFDPDAEDTTDEPERTSASEKTIVVGALTGAYMLGGYLIGLLWVTPVYVYAYLRYTDYTRWYAALLSLVMFGAAFGLMRVFRFPLANGEVMEFLGIEVALTVTVTELITVGLTLIGVS